MKAFWSNCVEHSDMQDPELLSKLTGDLDMADPEAAAAGAKLFDLLTELAKKTVCLTSI